MTEPLLQPDPNKPAALRALLKRGKTIPMPGGFNAITAKIIEDVGFPALYISGAGINNGVAGYPDIGMMTMTEMAQQAGYTARAVNIPAIADADHGFGEAVNVFRTVQEYERQGLSGLHIEDQVAPKRCGHLAGKQIISTENMVEKIRAACNARLNPDFLIVARVDARSVNGFDDAVARANAYREAGADMIFAEAMENEAEFGEFARQVPGWLLANMTEFGKTPLIPLHRFEELGYHAVIYPMTAFRIMMQAVRDAMAEILATGTQAALMEKMTPRTELYRLIHYPDYEQWDLDLTTQFSGNR
ncbi:MAG: methylisocitrate lyase [Candidatus Melainabacteria bacterium]